MQCGLRESVYGELGRVRLPLRLLSIALPWRSALGDPQWLRGGELRDHCLLRARLREVEVVDGWLFDRQEGGPLARRVRRLRSQRLSGRSPPATRAGARQDAAWGRRGRERLVVCVCTLFYVLERGVEAFSLVPCRCGVVGSRKSVHVAPTRHHTSSLLFETMLQQLSQLSNYLPSHLWASSKTSLPSRPAPAPQAVAKPPSRLFRDEQAGPTPQRSLMLAEHVQLKADVVTLDEDALIQDQYCIVEAPEQPRGFAQSERLHVLKMTIQSDKPLSLYMLRDSGNLIVTLAGSVKGESFHETKKLAIETPVLQESERQEDQWSGGEGGAASAATSIMRPSRRSSRRSSRWGRRSDQSRASDTCADVKANGEAPEAPKLRRKTSVLHLMRQNEEVETGA